MICPHCKAVFCDDRDYPPDSERRRRYCSERCRKFAKDRRSRRLRRARERSVPGACPRPYKLRFETMELAEAGAATAGEALSIPLHAYPCKCGWWHMTKKEPSQMAALEP